MKKLILIISLLSLLGARLANAEETYFGFVEEKTDDNLYELEFIHAIDNFIESIINKSV